MCINIEELTSGLANCAYRNRLVLFLGAGFSKAVMGYDPTDLEDHYSPENAKEVLSWLELLDKVRENLGLADKKLAEDQDAAIDCPNEASSIVSEIMANDPRLSNDDALSKLKEVVSKLVDWYPNPEQVCAYQELFQKIRPAAIVTTNYDEVIETILHKRYHSYGPYNTLGGLPKEFTPIYHIHGTRGLPDSILITREDYVRALRFLSYRQTRLACLLRENAVLYVGYGKNDINILSALDVAKNSFFDLSEGKDNIHVQVLYTSSNDSKVVENGKSQYSIEIKDTYQFLKQIAEKSESIKLDIDRSFEKYEEETKSILELSSAESNKVVKNKRKELSKLIKSLARQSTENSITSVHAKSLLITIIQKFFDAVYGETFSYGNFDAYDDSLFVLIELLVNLETLGLRSFFFDFAVKHLELIARYIGNDSGQSWKAYNALKNRWSEISDKVIAGLEESARFHDRTQTLALIQKIKEESIDLV